MNPSSVADGSAIPTGPIGTLDRWLAPIENAFNLIAALCIMGLMLLGVVQIVGRSLFNTPIWGYIDMVELVMAAFAFMGVAYCQRLGGHVRMELVLGRLPARAQYVFEVMATVVALGIVGVLVYYGYTHTMRAYTSGDSTIDAELLTWPSKALVPLAFSVLWLRLFINLLGYLRMVAHPDAHPVGIPVIEDVETQAKKELKDANIDVEENPMRGGLSE
jgi:TRAP-type C4-dicarboxylate transport system permease small subunit